MVDIVQAIPFSFAALFPVINPIAASATFASITHGASAKELKVLAFKIALYSAILLIAVLFTGSCILRAFGITTPVVLIGGGLVVVYMGWKLLTQSSSSIDEKTGTTSMPSSQTSSMTFFPLTLPVTISPACIAVAIALGAHSVARTWDVTLMNQIGSAIGILLVCATVFLCYKNADFVMEKLGKSGAGIIMRISAFINLCAGLQLIAHGMYYFMGGLI